MEFEALMLRPPADGKLIYSLPQDNVTEDGWKSEDLHDEQDWEIIDHPPVSDTEGTSTTAFHPVIEDFRKAIEEDPNLYMLIHQTFSQIPTHPPYTTEPSGAPQIRDYHTLLSALNTIIHTAPTFNPSNPMGAFVSMPLDYIFEWPMATPAGNALFHHPLLNVHLRSILNQWSQFLSSPASTYTLTSTSPDHWFAPPAMSALPHFSEEFICNPSAPHHGFSSWDAFFTRRYRPGIRPVASPNDDDIIVNPCEAAPLRLAHDVQARDTFWIKSQPYSLTHMLASDPLCAHFVGGTVYQANLGSLNYHRWHSPVKGTVVTQRKIPGAYYAEAASEGSDPEGPNKSSACITHVNTRAVVFIRADCERVGLLAFLAVGVQEISSCEVLVREGQRVEKGEEMGMFRFGGFSICLVLGKEVDVQWDFGGERLGLEAGNLRVCGALGRVRSRKPSSEG